MATWESPYHQMIMIRDWLILVLHQQIYNCIVSLGLERGLANFTEVLPHLFVGFVGFGTFIECCRASPSNNLWRVAKASAPGPTEEEAAAATLGSDGGGAEAARGGGGYCNCT